MEIFRIKFESDRYHYEGYWSSLAEAIINLHKCEKFMHVFRNNIINSKYNGCDPKDNKIYNTPNYKSSFSQKIEFLIDNMGIQATIPCFRYSRNITVSTEEVKEEGKLYKPALSKTEKLEDGVTSFTIHGQYHKIIVGHVEEIK